MRLVRFEREGSACLGVLEDSEVVELAPERGWPTDMIELIARGEEAKAPIEEETASAPRHSLSEVRLLAPLRPRKNVFAVGRNYLEHVTEVREVRPVPEHPVIFSKPPTAVIGPGEAIELANDPTGSTDYEGELAVVIGRPCHRIDPAEAIDHIFGYTIVNDVSSRRLQKRHSQWLIGKGADTFCPLGPAIVTAEEIEDVGSLYIRTRVNGELRQEAPVSEMIFDIPTIIATLCSVMTLEPGDVITTGTPGGVGLGFDPPRYLQPGDVVEVSIDRVGTLTNPVT
ncbi:MAG: fumarylacetoacetate hydrolase family protein [Acidimicrobiia bacterium]